MSARGRVARSLFFLFLAPAVAAAQAPPPAEGPVALVKDVAVQGQRRVQEAVILGRVSTKIGTPFQPNRLADDIRAIFALGFFDDVQLRVEDFEGGVKVTFVVVERPFIRDIGFAGNKQIDTATLQEKITLRLGGVYNPVEVNRAAERIKDHYEEEGYFEVSVVPDVNQLPDGDVSLAFRIVEGRKITIGEIVIEGAQGLTPKQVKAVMNTQERYYFFLRGTLQQKKLDEDVERIVALYNDHGYVQARVESTDVQLDREAARVTIRIRVVEGPQFMVGGVDVTGNTVLPPEEIRRMILLKAGEPFSRSKLRDTVRGIVDLYGRVGRAVADVGPSLTPDAANRLMNVVLEISEGPEVFVERINISGNVRSEEKILRREVPMAEGDLFTTEKLIRARQKLVNLGYFEQVKATTSPGASKEKIIVNIEVTEKPTGLFSIGGGYSSQDAFVGTLDLSQRNFLGKGWELFLRLRLGSSIQQGTVGFTDPWFLDRPLSAGFDLYSVSRDYDDYDVDSVGGNLRFSHPFGEFSRWSAFYRLSNDKISDVSDDSSQSLKDEEGTTLTSLIGVGLSRDTRDNVFEPTRGSQASVTLDFAGLGGDARFVRTVATVKAFHTIWFGHVFSWRVTGAYQTGWGGEDVPLFERFFLGGPNSVRSFKARDVGPEDSQGDPIGGNVEALGNIEYLIPLGLGFRFLLFYDVGQTWGPNIPGAETLTKVDLTDVRQAAGLGIRWLSPFGPLRAEYGFNLDRKKGEKSGQFHFSVGTAF